MQEKIFRFLMLGLIVIYYKRNHSAMNVAIVGFSNSDTMKRSESEICYQLYTPEFRQVCIPAFQALSDSLAKNDLLQACTCMFLHNKYFGNYVQKLMCLKSPMPPYRISHYSK